MQFEGTYTAIVTPFTADEALDLDAVTALVEHQAKGGITGIVPCGTTGESPTLEKEEAAALVRRVKEAAAGRCSVIAGAGSNSTKHAIELVRGAEKAGADAVMVVAPYYNKPTQEGLLRHFTAVAASTGLPVMLYNIPGRTGIDVLPDTVAHILEAARNVVAIKEATGNVLRAQELARRFGSRLTVLSGDDALTLAMVAVGARGVVSVTSNVLPDAVTNATALALRGDPLARKAHQALLPLHEAMFLEANPGPAKAALAALGLCKETVRSPLAHVSEATRKGVIAAMDAYRRAE